MRQLVLLLFLVSSICQAADELPLKLLRLPRHFHIEIFAYPVPGARSMALGKNGTVFVGTRENGKVYAIVPDAASLPYHTKIITLAEGLNSPNGVAFHDGDLFVAEIDRVLRFDDIEKRLNNPSEPVIITTELPSEPQHGWRYINFSPEGKLYISIGMPCNVCQQSDPRFGTIMRMNADGTDLEMYAKGIRNSEGFDWDPIDRRLWFTENGRDWMGDNTPPDKLDVANEKGLNFGFPFFDGKDLPDPEFGKLAPFKSFTLPALELPAHVAPLGVRFYTGTQFPEAYRNQILIAEHGSWNRNSKVGFQILLVKRTGTAIAKPQPFITGWLQKQQEWGRPVDILVLPDGSLLISDDLASVIYRVTYKDSFL